MRFSRTLSIFVVMILSSCGGEPGAVEPSPNPFAAPHDVYVEPFGCDKALNTSAPTRFYNAVVCLYEGEGALQQGVEPGRIDDERVAVLRGRVYDTEGGPLPGASVTVLGHPEFGRTSSRADGGYDLVVNGGGHLTVRVEMPGYLRAQRHVATKWRRFSSLPNIVLVRPSAAAPRVELAKLTRPILVRGPRSEDKDGARSHAMLIPPAQQVTAVLADGSKKELDSLTLRATEFTVGEDGVERMPADLPATSAYTYAIDLTLMEAEELGAEEVTFSPPVINYVDNFLNFKAGTTVPLGVYDEKRDVWEARESGTVIKIVGIKSGRAQVDVNGDDEADDEEVLNEYGIDLDELQVLAREYKKGVSLWRVSMDHFSTWDLNWPFGFPSDAVQAMTAVLGFGPQDCKRTVEGSIVGCEDQTLGEKLPLTGTSYHLHYQSERVPGRRDRYSLDISLSGDEMPESLKRIELEVEVLGKLYRSTHQPEAHLSHLWSWDGEDAYGRVWQGAQPVEVRVGYVYDGFYEETERFGQVGNGTPVSGDRAREEITSWTTWTGTVGGFNYSGATLGSWSIDAHHVLDRRGGKLHLGNGRTRGAKEMGPVVSTIAGVGQEGFEGDGGAPLEARFDHPHGLVTAPDGTVYISDEHNHRIRRIRVDGTIDTYAGNGEEGRAGDGGKATEAQLGFPLGLALGQDGTLYVCQRNAAVVRMIDRAGIISTFAGGAESTANRGDGALAVNGQFDEPHAVAVAPDGSVYVADADDNQVRRIDPAGILSTVVGRGELYVIGRDLGDGGPAREALVDTPLGIAIGHDGSLYVTEFKGHRIRRVGPTGVISTIAGTGTPGFSGDGGRAVVAEIDNPHDVQVGMDGAVYFSDEGNNRIRRIRLDGIIETVAGGGDAYSIGPSGGDGGPPTAAYFPQPRVLYAHSDGSLWIGDYQDDRIRRIDPPFANFSQGETTIASSDGKQLYVFDSLGRHQRTLDALTGFPYLTFGYDSAGELTSLLDGNGRVTTISRTGASLTSVVGPYGHQTNLELDVRGFLVESKDPGGTRSKMKYSDDGLLTSFETGAAGEVHLFQYDENGLLLRDTNPTGYYQALERRSEVDGFSVTRTHRNSRPEVHRIFSGEGGEQTRVLTDAAGLSRITRRSPGHQHVELPTATNEKWLVGDPRFGMQAPIATEQRLLPAPGHEIVVTREVNVDLSEPRDPLSIESWQETVSINDAKWVTIWEAEELTTTLKSPKGRSFVRKSNESGQVTMAQFADLLPQEMSYDDDGRLSQVKIGDRIHEFVYGKDGLLETSINPLGQSVSFERNAVGQVTTRRFADGSVVSTAYDPLRRLSSLQPSGAEEHHFTYVPGGLLDTYAPPAASGAASMSFAYDKYNALETVNDGSGELGFSYEQDTGRLSQVLLAEGTTSYLYDASTGQLIGLDSAGVALSFSYEGSLPLTQKWSGVIDGAIEFGFDADLRLGHETVSGERVDFEYDDDGLLLEAGKLEIKRDSKAGRISSSRLLETRAERTYNDYGELIHYGVQGAGETLLTFDDERDALGRLSRRREVLLDTTSEKSFSYDLRGRLTQVEEDGSLVEEYQYDANGNRTSAVIRGVSIVAVYDEQDRLREYGSLELTPNPSGDLQRKSEGSKHTDYTYDRLGRLIKVKLPDDRVVEYSIDGVGRRVAKKIDGALVQGYLYRDRLSPVAELASDGRSVKARFVYGTSRYVPDYMMKEGETYRIVTDQVGSVRLVVNAKDGTIAQRLSYTAFGEIEMDTNPGFQPFGFAGGIYDVDTGLVRFGARDYDPSVGRWTAKDPILFAGGQANLYVYVGNDPVNFVDPEGEFGLAGALIGGGVNFGLQYLANGGDQSKIDYTDVALSAAFGVVSGGVGTGLKALQASTRFKIGLGVVAGAEIATARELFKGAVNQTQGDPSNITGFDLAKSAAIGAATCGFGQR